MLTIRVWVIAAAAAFVTSPLAHAQSHDCDRYPAVCEQPAEAKAVTEPAPRLSAPVKKRKAPVAKRPEKSRADPEASRTAHEQPASPTLRGTTTVDAAVMLPQSLVDTDPAPAMAPRTDSPALAAAGAWITLPTDDPRTGPGVELATVGQENVADPAGGAVRFVNSDEVNEIDLAAREPEPADFSWLRYLVATLGAALAAASMVRLLSFV